MMTENELRKVCPRCGGDHDLAAPVCEQCGRRFQTLFTPGHVPLSLPALNMPALRSERPLVGRNSPPLVASVGQLRLARPKPLVVTAAVPPEVQHRAALDEYASQFLGLAQFYVLAVLTAPALLLPLLVLTPVRAAEARTCALVAALGVDAEAWAAPLRRARAARIVRGVGTALALALLLVVSVLALHKGISYLDAKMDPLLPDSDGTGAPSSN